MNNAVSVQVLAAQDDLLQVVAGPWACELSSACAAPGETGIGGQGEMGAGAQTQGREGVSLGKGSQDATNHFFRTELVIQTPPPQNQAATVHSNPSHWLPPKTLTWDPLRPLRKLRDPSIPVPELGSNRSLSCPSSPGSSEVWLQLPSA